MRQTAFIRRADGSFEQTSSITDCARALREPDTRLWLDLDQPDEWTLALLGEAFEFHPLAIEDCLHGEQRVRIDPYGDYFFMVMYVPLPSGIDGHVESRELAMFCSARYVVTIHHQPIDSVAGLLTRCERDPAAFLSRGTDHVLHVIVDSAVDQYGPILDRLEDETTELEDAALTEPSPEVLERLTMVRNELLGIRRLLMPVRDVVAQLARGEFGFVGTQMQLYFRDVLDHLVRTVETIEIYRDQISGARDIYLSSISQKLNEVMKVLTIFATIMLPLSLIAGIYGMNVTNLWPPTDRPYSFWIVMGMMVAITVGLLYFFRRRKWI
jgi:magnesium transporter